MISQATQNEINGYKSQLNDFLASRYIDQSLILGFTTVIQSKFHSWISADVEEFHQLYVSATDEKQIDISHCNSIEYLRVLWADFHHPIVKSYQKQHAELFTVSVRSMKNNKKNFKSVEMRKLSESFDKYVKAVKAFYTLVMRDLCTRYANPLVPQKYLQEFEIIIPAAEDEASYIDFHTTLSYITFLCLVGLGNVSRNWAQIRLSYVDPCKSISAYYKHLSKDKAEGKSLYIFPLLCYSKCVGLLPTMHEPYNHIGVIYNSLGQKFSAILWFLRSQFTRDGNIAVGRRNLLSAITRPWLEDAYNISTRKSQDSIEPADTNIIVLRLIADHFYRTSFRKSLYTEKVETDLLNIMFSEPYHEQFVRNSNVIAEHMTVFICFYELAAEEKQLQARDRFGAFLLRYVTAYLATLKTSTFQATDAETPLKNIRLILAFVRKNQSFSKTCGAKFLESLVDAFNALQELDGEETKTRVVDVFVEGKPPVRSHYFSEDIHFKDFTPIGCQFKDFNDTHLFESGNIHLLFGSHFCENDNGMPEFLDNEAVLRINKEAELASGDKFSREKAIAAECSRAENILRLQASVALAKKIFGTRIHLDSEKERFEVERLNVPKTQKSVVEKGPQKKTKTKPEKPKMQKPEQPKTAGPLSALAGRPEMRKHVVQVPATLPSSIEEIESMILGHAPKLINKGQEPDREAGLADMVSAIVSEDEMRDTLTTAGEGLQDISNDELSKSTDSSRVESHFADHAQFFYPSNSQAFQNGQPMVRPEEGHQGASFERPGFHNSPVSHSQNYPVSQNLAPSQTPFVQHAQWYMGNNGQAPPGASYGTNMLPPTAFSSAPMTQQNGPFYPQAPQYHTQNMGPIPGTNFGVFPPPYMMAQYQQNMPTQEGYAANAAHGSAANYLYPQYSSQ